MRLSEQAGIFLPEHLLRSCANERRQKCDAIPSKNSQTGTMSSSSAAVRRVHAGLPAGRRRIFRCLHRTQSARNRRGKISARMAAPRRFPSARCEFLNPAVVWPRLRPPACPILDIRIADGCAPGHLDFSHSEIGDDPFGWIIENHIFHDGATAGSRLSLKMCSSFCSARWKRSKPMTMKRAFMLEDGRMFTASLLVGADGRHSAMPRTT